MSPDRAHPAPGSPRSAWVDAPAAARSFERVGALRPARPLVLILDDLGSEHFHQLACTLRRRGVATMKVTSGRGPGASQGWRRLARAWRDHLMYDARVTAAQLRPGWPPQAALDAGRVVDVLASEPTLATLAACAPGVGDLARRGLACAGLPPHRLIDKFEVNAILEQGGVPIPRQLSAERMSPAQAAGDLGLPLVVKACVGAGGGGVRVAHSIEEIERALAEVSARGGGAFYQKHVDGQMVMYGSVSGASGPLIEHGFRVGEAQWPLGPSARIRLFDDPTLIAMGRRAVGALGCRGFAEIGFLRDDEGGLWHVDANCRSWGNMISLLSVGIDFTQAYAALVLGTSYRPRPSPAHTAPAEEIAVLPFSLYQAASRGSLREIASHLERFAIMCWRGPGLRYAAPVAVKVAALVTRRLLKRLLRLVRTEPRGRITARP
jgi:hypothetical protein